jgi:drug/metabolite transporter (DMT)-like permease
VRGRMAGMLRRIHYVRQVLRLSVLMLVGAAVGYALQPVVGHGIAGELEERVFHGAIVGAFCGLAVELFVRLLLPVPQHDIPLLRFSLRTLLIVVTYAAILMGFVAYALRR